MNKNIFRLDSIAIKNVIFFAIISIVLLKLIIKIWSLDKGITMNDDGYYLLLLKDIPTEIAFTNYFKYFHNIWFGDIYKMRVTVFLVDLISAILFSVGLHQYYKNKYLLKTKDLFLIIAYCYIGFNLCAPPFFGVYSYVTMNRQIMLIALGILYWGFSINKSVLSNYLFLVSGLLTGSLFFIMITNTPIIFIIGGLIYFHTKKIRGILFFIIGILFSFLYYFSFVESFSLFLNNFLLLFKKTSVGDSPKGYGIIPMIKWLLYIVYYGLQFYVVPVLAICGLYFIKKFELKIVYYLLLSAFVFVSILFYIHNVYLYNNWESIGISSTDPVFIFLIFLVLISYFEKNITIGEYTDHIFLSFVIPVFLTLGTIISFDIRATEYLMFILPSIFVFTNVFKNSISKYQLLLFVMVFMYSFNSIYSLSKNNWAEIVYIDQTFPLKTIDINQSLKLDKKHYEQLKKMKTVSKENEKVILSCHTLWGYAYLLSLKPADYNFRVSVHAQDSTLINTVYIEDAQFPFDNKMKAKFTQKNATVTKIDDKLTVYRFD